MKKQKNRKTKRATCTTTQSETMTVILTRTGNEFLLKSGTTESDTYPYNMRRLDARNLARDIRQAVNSGTFQVR